MPQPRLNYHGVPVIAALTGLLGLTVVIVSGLVIRFIWQGEPFAIDLSWHDFLGSQRSSVLNVAANVLNVVGGTQSMLLVTAGIVVALVVARRWRDSLTIGLTVALASGLAFLLKVVVARPRPLDGIVDTATDAFPSGHTTTAAALALALALTWPRLWTWALAGLWIAAMAFSRTYLLVHWASDVVAAVVLGASVALLIAALAAPAHHPQLLRKRVSTRCGRTVRLSRASHHTV